MQDVIFSVFQNENYIDLDLYQSGLEHCKPGHIFGPCARNHYLFHYVLSGKGTLVAQSSTGKDQTFEIHAGQGFLIFPGKVNTYYADNEHPWTYAWLEFDGLRVKEALEVSMLSVDSPVYKAHTPKQRDAMVAQMKTIVLDGQKMSSFATIGHLYLFFDHLIQSTRLLSEKKSSRLADFYIKEAVSYIEQNYQKGITVEEIAGILGIDRSYFGKLFKRIMGKSPQQFLINYRLVKAAQLLKSTDQPINVIASSVGYENQLHFSRAFKAAYGLSPREWRKDNATVQPVHGQVQESEDLIVSEQSPSAEPSVPESSQAAADDDFVLDSIDDEDFNPEETSDADWRQI